MKDVFGRDWLSQDSMYNLASKNKIGRLMASGSGIPETGKAKSSGQFRRYPFGNWLNQLERHFHFTRYMVFHALNLRMFSSIVQG